MLIGDSKYDAIGAAQAEIDFIAVTYGFGFKDQNDLNEFRYKAVCDCVGQLQTLLI